jgi:release factor glutamine methyltransferase
MSGSEKALEIQLLIEHIFKLTRTEFWIKKNQEIKNLTALKKFYRYRKRLLKDEPLAYILKKKEFYGEYFFVNKNVLIPRPETEILIDEAVKILKKPGKVLDIGAGSGNISIMLAKLTRSNITSVEKHFPALKVLRKNIFLHKLHDKITVVNADLFPLNRETYDLIVSNPPYIPEKEWNSLATVVRDYEPKEALVPGLSGLELIQRIIQRAGSYLKPKGRILIEIGYNQKGRVDHLLRKANFSNIRFYRDYNNVQRIAFGEFRP